MIDLGAIAKGYIADQIKSYLLKNKVNSALINLGGNILCVGQKNNNPFSIGITDPQNTNHSILSLNINNLSIVTSGTYQRYIEINSKKYHHILIPQLDIVMIMIYLLLLLYLKVLYKEML